ncbi:MAG: D-alanyl-D-alanine carboxypeptidase family protein [Micropruina sp.]|nr:D-alanyl-D-alanine carboxypeptidase family protein [Micropruina sp.]
MSSTTRRARTGRGVRAALAGLVLTAAAVLATAGCAPPPSTSGPDEVPQAAPSTPAWRADGTVDRADGVLPDGVSVFDNQYPGVANLDPDLRRALRAAATRAAEDGVAFEVASGWRSPEYQEQLLRQAIAQYGSKKKAARWVATPTTSAHVAGDAIDIAHADATTRPAARAVRWLTDHGADYGLCQIYRNEPWHFELRPDAVAHGCPDRYADPTKDPRMRE